MTEVAVAHSLLPSGMLRNEAAKGQADCILRRQMSRHRTCQVTQLAEP